MGLSFEESLIKAQNSVATFRMTNPAVASVDITEDIATYAGEEESFQLSTKYLYYADYSDERMSTIDEKKNITLHQDQINLTQETNSQYIPFEMARYYDGFDLMKTNLLIHFVNADGYEDYATPINVYSSPSKIRFAWLVDKRVTAIEGIVKFEIHAVGVNSKGDEYIWKTQPSDKLNVLESLCGNGVIVPDQNWISSFMTQITDQVSLAQSAVVSAERAAEQSKTYAAESAAAAGNAQSVVDGAKEELAQSVESAVAIKVEEELTEKLADIETKIDNLDGLANFDVGYDGEVMTFYNGEDVMKEIEINSDPSAEWTSAYTAGVNEKIAVVQDDLNAYKEATNADLASIHGAIDGLPETLASDYYTKTDADIVFATKDSVNAVSAVATTNKTNIDTLSTKILELDEEVSGIDKSPRLTYEATYNEEQIYTLWEIEGEGDSAIRTPKGQFKIQGGGGGSSTSSVLKIEYVTKTPLVATINDKVEITYNFSGTDSSGDAVLEGTASWRVGNTTVYTQLITAGENTFDITDYLSIGTQKVVLSITDDAGSLVTKSWTVQKIDVRIESTFNDTLTYPIGNRPFDYTPYGAVAKTVHFILDGNELETVSTTSSGIPMEYILPEQVHGSHLLEVYMTANINGNTIESNHIFKDIIWYDPNSTVPVISCIQQKFTARQYDTTNIEFVVYDPSTETPDITLSIDGTSVSTITLTSNTHIWQYKSVDVGDHELTITCGETVKTLKATITKLDIKLEPVTAGLVFDFNPTGKSNADADRVWSQNDVAMTVSDNFDWVNGGYQLDENGDQYFCIKAGTSAEINYHLFADDAKRNGKELKLVFKTTNVQTPDAQFLSCIDHTTESDHIGIEMNVHEAYLYAQAGKLHLPYSEEDIIEFEFNISKDTESIPMVMGYEDGVSTCPMVYDGSHNFTQTNPDIIHLGSAFCDLHIYRMKVYNASLTDRGILSNFIADARNADEMVSRYNRNQIYDENSQLNPDVLAEKCPHLRIIKLEAPWFTNNKDDKVPGTKIEYIYKDGDPKLDNWTAYNCMHSGQGTSSNNYGASGRNLDLIMNKSGVEGVTPYIELGDKTRTDKISLTRDSVPVAYLNVKVNIASSENANNALLQKRYNEYNPYKRAFVREDETEIPKIKDTMEFYNCVVFIKESDKDLTTHREFADNDWHFYAIGNVGDSKKTDKTRLTDPSDRYEFTVEIKDVEKKNSDFPADEQGIADLEADQFDGSETYEFRYIWEDGTDEENAEVFEYARQKWIDFYKFVVTSTDEEFYAHLGDYFVLDSALYYYLFTTRYTMVDNRAKNSFWHYGKTGEVDADGQQIRKWDLSWDYDNDTALGINNYGDMVYRYGYEDTDFEDGTTQEVFRESDSTFFCRLRDLFGKELKELYNTLESANAWSATGLINQWDSWQNQFPEELWRVDIERKYIRTYNSSFINSAGDAQFLNNMAHGRKKYQRREYERNQEKYMASKYQSSLAFSDSSILRCTVPTEDVAVTPNYSFKITPYAHMYINVQHGTSEPIQVRAKPNIEYDVPFDGDSTDIVNIYSSSMIQSFGDLSATYPATVDVRNASKLKQLVLGNDTEGYDNPSLTSLTLGSNTLLEILNIENVSGLEQTLDLSILKNLKQLYAHGSNVGGVTFADGGLIEIAELPAINAITMKNLMYLATLDCTSFDNLTKLVVEECDTVDLITILNNAKNLNRVRIIGIEWDLDDTALLERLYTMYGVDKNGYNSEQSVLTGSVFTPVIRQQQLYEYQKAWPDLSISYNTMIEQYPVTFINEDGTILDVQYVDKGGNAVDPVTREDNPIEVPKKESTISTDFTFSGWDSVLTGIFSDRTIKALYTESTRSYTIKYVSKGITLQESVGLYNENVIYTGAVPTYTLEESAYKYYLFNRWDKSGVIDGDKVVNAVFDTFEYTTGAFDGRELSDLSLVEIYALTKIGVENTSIDIQEGDKYSFELGYDLDYDDIRSELIVSETIHFDGTNYLDTEIKLLDEDRDFVLAIDYEFLNGNSANSVLAQCFQSNGTNGFKLWYNSGVRFTWGTSTTTPANVGSREMIVIRHKKGDHNLMIYNSNLDTEYTKVELTKNRASIADSTLVLGCMKADDGAYENYAVGNIHWCKVWYADLGDETCTRLVGWVHEKVDVEVSGFKKYYLTENPSKRATFTFLASHLLASTKAWNTNGTNAGGWASSTLNTYLNNRLYPATSPQMQLLIKQVSVPSSAGQQSQEIISSDCYITIPAIIELTNESSVSIEPYIYEGSTIPYMISEEMRKRGFRGGEYNAYWTRSPNIAYPSSYVYQIDEKGKAYGFGTPKSTSGVLIELSI